MYKIDVKKVKIVEVGPRDGLQNEKQTIPTKDKLIYIKKLVESGLKNIEATSFVNPEWVPQLSDASEIMVNLSNCPGVCFSALVPNMKGLERAIESGVKRIAIFTAASETFNKKNINMSIRESLNSFKDVIGVALKNKMSVRGYISTCFVCPYEGDIKKEKVFEITKELEDFGVDEISIGDTIGAASPLDVYNTVEFLTQKIQKEKLALHFHDTYGTALVNVLAGLELGISTFDSSSGGLGGCPYAKGASGNLATEDLVYLLNKMNIECEIDLKKLSEASLFIENLLGKVLPSKQLTRIKSL